MNPRRIPTLLITFRFALIPVMLLVCVIFGKTAILWLTLMLLLGVASDVFDGIIARRLHCDTDKLRRLDSQTDALFWVTVIACTSIMDSAWLKSHGTSLIALLGMELGCYLSSFLRFGRETCTHSYLSKAWGVSLTLAFTTLWVGFSYAEPLWHICVVLGLVSQLEVLAILALLPRWERDIPSALSAWRIRRPI